MLAAWLWWLLDYNRSVRPSLLELPFLGDRFINGDIHAAVHLIGCALPQPTSMCRPAWIGIAMDVQDRRWFDSDCMRRLPQIGWPC